MSKNNLTVGGMGEDMARKYLEDKGYFFIEQNYRNKYGEIDLVMEHESALIFVEVKTRVGEQFGTPEDALNGAKVARLVRNANMYAMKMNCDDYRIDGVCIVLNSQNQIIRIDHYKNINL